MSKVWMQDPHAGGVNIPEKTKSAVKNRILKYAEAHYAGKYDRIDVRFKSQFCYIDAYVEPCAPKNYDATKFGESKEEHLDRLKHTPIHLCRLRYKVDEEKWTLAFYTYSNEK